jgi:hypothetical protein
MRSYRERFEDTAVAPRGTWQCADLFNFAASENS